MARHGQIDTTNYYIVYVIWYLIYGARGGIFAAITLFVDPSLARGLAIVYKTWRGHRTSTSSGSSTSARAPRGRAGMHLTTAIQVTVELQEFGGADSPQCDKPKGSEGGCPADGSHDAKHHFSAGDPATSTADKDPHPFAWDVEAEAEAEAHSACGLPASPRLDSGGTSVPGLNLAVRAAIRKKKAQEEFEEVAAQL